MKKRLLSLILVVTVMTMSVSGTFGTFTVSASGTYDTVPALVDVSPKYVIYEGTAFQGTFGSNGVTGQGHLPGYSSGSPAQKTFAAGSVSDYGRFEFDFYLDDASIVAARNIKLYLNLRVDTSVSGSRGTYEFQDQIIEDGWNHVIVDAGLADNILEALTITKFYIDMDASGTGASDRYKVANICATQEAYKVVPAMPDVSPRFDIQTGSAFSGTWGSNAITGQGHLPGYSPAAKVFTNPGLSDYGCFEFDFYLDDVSIIATRNLKLYLNLRRANDSSITTFEYQDQITSSGWNHVKITTGMTDANLNDIGRIRFYIDIDAGSTGATDRYKVANICATQEAYKVVPAMPDVSPRFDIQTGSAFSGTWGSNAVTGQGHLPGYSPAAKVFTNPGLSDYGCFEFDFYLDDVSIIATRNLKLYLNLRRANDSSITTFEYQDQITSSGWNHVKITTGMTDANLNDIGRIRFYVDIDAGSTGASDRYKVANICATQEAYKAVPAMPDISPRFDIQTGSAFSGTWGSNAVTGQGHLPGYSPAAKVFTNPGLSDYGCFEFDFYLDDVSIITTRNLKLYLNLRRANDSSITTFEYQDQITSSGWNHVKITTGMTDANLNDIGRIRFYIDIDAGSIGAADRYKVANICATVDSYKTVPAMPTGAILFTLAEGVEYQNVWGSSSITDQGYMNGTHSEILFDNPGLSSYDYFEFDVYIDDLANFTARATKLYFNVRDNDYKSKELVEYTEQIASDGWNHVKIPFTLSDSVLDSLHVIRFYMDIDAGETGATDRYRIANICATMAYTDVPGDVNNDGVANVKDYVAAKLVVTNVRTDYNHNAMTFVPKVFDDIKIIILG